MHSEDITSQTRVLLAGIGHVARLDDNRYETLSAANLEDVVEAIQTQDIDCVVTDYRIGDKTAIDLVDRIEDTDSPPPVILWTADGSERIASRAIHAGVAEYLPKDANGLALELTDVIERVTSRPGRAPVVADQSPDSRTARTGSFLSVIDGSGRLNHVSSAASQAFGHDPEQMVGDNYLRYVHPDDRQRVRAAVERVREGSESTSVERMRFLNSAGEWQATAIDITEHLRGASVPALAIRTQDVESAPAYDLENTAFEAVSDGVLVLDEQGRVRDTNPPARDLLGPTDDGPTESFETVLPPETGIDDWWQAVETNAEGEFQMPLVVDEREALAQISVTTTAAVRGYVVVIRNLEGTSTVEQDPEKILNRVNDGFYALDDAWRFTYLNDAGESIIQRDREELLGERLWDALPGVEDTIIEEQFRSAMETQEPVHFQTRYESLEVDAAISAHPSPTGLSVYFRDVTAERASERELENRNEQERALSALTRRAFGDCSPDSLFELATELVTDVLDDSYCGILDWKPADGELRLESGVGWRDGLVGSASLSDTYQSQAGYTLHSNTPAIVVDDFETEGRFSEGPVLTSHGVQSGISASIGPAADPWGVVCSYDTERQSYAEHEVQFLESVADVLYRALERQTRDRELEQYETVVESIEEGVWITDTDNRITFLNDQAAKVLDHGRTDLIGETIESLFHDTISVADEDAHEVIRGFEAVSTGERSRFHTELPIQTKATDVRLEIQCLPVRRDGDVTGIIGIAHDITERYERERRTEASKREYRTLIDAVPDPIVALDTTTKEVYECNTAAEQLWRAPRDELIGADALHLHPERDADRYEELIADMQRDPQTFREFDNGDPIEIETVAGECIEVVANVERLDIHDRTLLVGIFRDVTEQRKFEESLTALHQTARALSDTETKTEIADTVVDVSESVLDHSSTAVYLHDEVDNVLRPAAHSSPPESIIGKPPSFEPGESIAWEAFTDGETRVFDDVRTADAVYRSNTEFRSEVIIPLGDHGVFLAGGTREGIFDERIVELTEMLVANAEAALDRAEREASLRERESELRVQNQQFETISKLGRTVTQTSRGIIGATTKSEIEQLLCEALAALDTISLAWVASPSDADAGFEPSTYAGEEHGYLDVLDLTLENDQYGTEPTTRAAGTESVINISDIIEETGDWKQEALLRDLRSSLSVPLIYNEGFYGVLSVYSKEPDAFAFPTENLISHTVRLAAYAINTVEIRNAVLHNRVVELQFSLDESTDSLYRIAADLDCRITYVNTRPQPDGRYRIEVSVDDVDTSAFEERALQSFAVESVERLDRRERRYEIVSSEQGLPGEILELGAKPTEIILHGDSSRLTVELSNMTNIRPFVKRLKNTVTVTLQSQKTRDHSEAKPPTSLLGEVTDRQHEVLRTAYDQGYFEQPRESDGQDVAESLGISQPAFSTHLRKCERTLFESLFEST